MKKKQDNEMSINEVDNVTEGVLYFLKYILLKHFIKIIIFLVVCALVFAGYNCETKWFKFNKEPIKTKYTESKN